MIHIRIDDETENSKRRFACGIGPVLPEGDKYFFQSEGFWHHRVDCLGCNPGGPWQLGTPMSELSGRPGHPGYWRFRLIAKSWGQRVTAPAEAFVPVASTPEMRNRLRELASPPRDDFDRAVLIVLDDFDRLYAAHRETPRPEVTAATGGDF